MAKFDLVVAAKTVGAGSIKRLGNSMQGVTGKVKNLRLALGGLNKTFGALGLIISGGAFVGLVKGAIDSADSFGKLSDQTGIAANTLQAYTNAGKLAGVGQETIDKGLRRLAQSMREADQGVATYSDSYKALGISVRDSDGNLKSSETVLGEIADKFADLPDGATKAAISMEIFGRSGASLINLLNGGSAALSEFNYAVSDEFAQNAEFFNDQIAVLAIRFDGFRKQLADALLPTLNNLIGVFSDLFTSQQDFTMLFDAIGLSIKTVSASIFTTIAGFKFLGRVVTDILKIINEARKGNFKGAIGIGKEGLADTKEQFKEDMKVFNDIFTGTENAPATYFKEGTKSVKEFSEEITKSFGSQMQSKLATFTDSIKTLQESMADVVVKGIKGMEDALVNFVTTGKLNFKNLANSIISDMARIAIQQTITKPFSNFLSGIFGNANGNAFVDGKVQKYAYGGVVNRPTFFPMANGGVGLMGEAGYPEAILPLRRGSNGKLGVQSTGSSVGNIVVNVDASGSSVQGDQQQGRELGRIIAIAVQSELIQQKRPGGLLA
tara:strand:+ start:1181 stop:2836 length:1656 start_codon:yes stop_codon:yes gene_type:complete